jgi:hypothetical protein
VALTPQGVPPAQKLSDENRLRGGGGARNKYKNLKGNPRGERAYFFALLGLHEKNPLTHTGDMYIKRPCCMLVVCFSAFEVRRFGVDVAPTCTKQEVRARCRRVSRI